ncbi:hypothetical protein ACVW0P_003906 [Mucilaginibacter sp. UYNi724]
MEILNKLIEYLPQFGYTNGIAPFTILLLMGFCRIYPIPAKRALCRAKNVRELKILEKNLKMAENIKAHAPLAAFTTIFIMELLVTIVVQIKHMVI